MTNQIKSKQRVADHGEVFTSEREVEAMCDLVEQETERIDSRFLEPACGDGNFLSVVLKRKLAVVKRSTGAVPTTGNATPCLPWAAFTEWIFSWITSSLVKNGFMIFGMPNTRRYAK